MTSETLEVHAYPQCTRRQAGKPSWYVRMVVKNKTMVHNRHKDPLSLASLGDQAANLSR